MSSPSTGPYKSRLFNLLNRQSLRLKDKSQRAFRRVKVAAEWGMQILLYPLYLLVQGGTVAGRQLQQSVQETKFRLQASPSELDASENLTPDTPIQNILQAVEAELISAEAPPALDEINSPAVIEALATRLEALHQKTLKLASEGQEAALETTSELKIRGVASLLGDRSLVLVTSTNGILEILTPTQQKQLQQRICWELADYYRQYRLQQRHPSSLPPSFQNKTQKPHVLAPVRWFWQLMSWVQTSKVAIAADLFGESTLIQYFAPSPPPSLPPILEAFSLRLHPTGTLTRLDITVAEIEAKPPIPVQKLGIVLRQGFSQLGFSKPPQTLEETQGDSLTIQALLCSAIDYFFGSSSATPTPSLPSATPPSPELPAHPLPRLLVAIQVKIQQKLAGTPVNPPQLPPAVEPDPWLSWNDLFGQSLSSSPPAVTITPSPILSGKPIAKQNALPSASPTPLPPLESPQQLIQQNLQKTQDKALQAPEKIPTKVVISEIPLTAESVSPPELLQHELVSPHSETRMEAKPDWLEAEVTPAGYIKHPLEQILEWLDRVMVWLENLIMKLWRGLRGK